VKEREREYVSVREWASESKRTKERERESKREEKEIVSE